MGCLQPWWDEGASPWFFHLPALRAPQKTPRKPQHHHFPPPISPSLHLLYQFPRPLIAWLRIGAPPPTFKVGIELAAAASIVTSIVQVNSLCLLPLLTSPSASAVKSSATLQ